MPIELYKEKWTNKIFEVKIGRTKDEGGTRETSFKIGGESTLPFLSEEGEIPNLPKIAMEVWDAYPKDWDEALVKYLKDVIRDPVEWANFCISKLGADAINLKVISASDEFGGRSPEAIEKSFLNFIKNVKAPLIITGCGDVVKDNLVLSRLSALSKNEGCLFGVATQDNYKTLAVSANADNHTVIAESPIDINIAKQANILISDMGLDPSKIVMHPTTAALGYGLEYVYSIMERSRLAALNGDKMLSMPFILFVGQEVWRIKETRESLEMGVMWEIATGISMIQAGADILVMRHPKAAREVKRYISFLQ